VNSQAGVFTGAVKRYFSTIGDYPFLASLLSLTYGIGELIQWQMIGPDWLRWHLSDFGFPLSIGAALHGIFRIPAIIGVPLSGIAGIAFEMLQFSQGTGDPIDVVCLIAGTVVGMIIALKTRKLSQ